MTDSKDETAKNQKKPQKKKTPRKISERYLRNSGLFYLQRFTASSGHFKTVMARKINNSCYFHKDQDAEECLAMLDKVTAEFLEQGLLDDDGYVRGMVTSLRRSGKSRKIIMAKLAQKRVPNHAIEQALEQYDQENYEDPREAEFISALTLARKKRLGPFDTIQKYEPEKALNILARNGFSYDTSKRVMEIKNDELFDMGYAAL